MRFQMVGGAIASGFITAVACTHLTPNWTRPIHENLPGIPSTIVSQTLVPLTNVTKHPSTTATATLSLNGFTANSSGNPTFLHKKPKETDGRLDKVSTARNSYISDSTSHADTTFMTVTKTVLCDDAENARITETPGQHEMPVYNGQAATAEPSGSSLENAGQYLTTLPNGAATDPGTTTTMITTTTVISLHTSTVIFTLSGFDNQSEGAPLTHTTPCESDLTTITSTTTSTDTSMVTLRSSSLNNEPQGAASTNPTLSDSSLTTMTSTYTSPETTVITLLDVASELGESEPTAVAIRPSLTGADTQPPHTPAGPTTSAYYQVHGADSWNSTNQVIGTPPSPGPHSQGIVERQAGAMVTATIDGEVVSWWDGGVGTPQFPPQMVTELAASTPPSELPSMSRVGWDAAKNTTRIGFQTKTNEAASSTLTPPTTTPAVCGESGEFTIHFDDLPVYTPPKNNDSSLRAIFNPYHHFFFSGGWFYSPPSNALYHPTSEPHVGVFDPSKGAAPGSPYAGMERQGEFGTGPRTDQDAFLFDAYSAYFGCASRTYDTPCVVTVSAAKYAPESNKEEITANSTFYLPPCPSRKKCHLTQIDFGPEFRGLSGIIFAASVADKPVAWFIDDISLDWHDNSCAAGLTRIRSK